VIATLKYVKCDCCGITPSDPASDVPGAKEVAKGHGFKSRKNKADEKPVDLCRQCQMHEGPTHWCRQYQRVSQREVR
jgi:hypothetical protein